MLKTLGVRRSDDSLAFLHNIQETRRRAINFHGSIISKKAFCNRESRIILATVHKLPSFFADNDNLLQKTCVHKTLRIK